MYARTIILYVDISSQIVRAISEVGKTAGQFDDSGHDWVLSVARYYE